MTTEDATNPEARPRILGLCASLRSGRWEKGQRRLIDQLMALESEEALREFLQEESSAHLQNFLDAGRKEGVPFDELYAALRKTSGTKGLCNSEVALAAALWSAKMLGASIDYVSLSSVFGGAATARDMDALREAILEADGILLSTPVYFGDRSSLAQGLIRCFQQDPALIEKARSLFYAGLTVGAKRNGGQETALIYQLLDMVNTGVCGVGNDAETTSQYGGTMQAGDVGMGWKDEYGLWTSMGTGRRIVKAIRVAMLGRERSLRTKLRLGVVVLQDRDGIAREQIDSLLEANTEQVEATIIDAQVANIRRCIACDICPTHVGLDAEYRCIVKNDFLARVHESFLGFDALVPVALAARDAASVTSMYQCFNERTRYLRRGDYLFTNMAVAPFVVEEVGANDSLRMRMMTSTVRHHTVMTRPLVTYLHEGRVLNAGLVREQFEEFLAKARTLTIGRLVSARRRDVVSTYNPHGYVLSVAKEKEDRQLDSRQVTVDERMERLRRIAHERLE